MNMWTIAPPRVAVIAFVLLTSSPSQSQDIAISTADIDAIEKRVVAVAQAIERGTLADAPDKSRAELRAVVSDLFDARVQAQKKQIATIQERLGELQRKLESQVATKETIVEKRVELILADPSVLSSREPLRDASVKTAEVVLPSDKVQTVERIEPNDILFVYLEGVLPFTPPNQPPLPPPVTQAQNGIPVSGYPIAVQSDGTVALPLVDPIDVGGRTVIEATALIRELYISKDILRREKCRPILTLVKR